MSRTRQAAVWMAGIVLAAGVAQADPPKLAGNQTIGDYTAGRINIVLDAPDGPVPFGADALGVGTGGWAFAEASVAGLDLGDYSLENTDGRAIRLDLNGGDLVANTGFISTDHLSVHHDHVRNIVLRNVGDIALGDGYLSMRFNNSNSGEKKILVGTESSPVASVQVAKIVATHESTIFGWNDHYPSEIEIHSSGDVLIENSDGDAGDFLAGGAPLDNANLFDGHWRTAISVKHHGDFLADRISFGIRAQYNRTGSMYSEFDGAAHGDWPGGAFVAGEIDGRTIAVGGTSIATANHLIIRNYRSVSVERILLDRVQDSPNWGYDGDIDIVNIKDDIVIDDTVSSYARHHSSSMDRFGHLTLQAGGTITMGSLNLYNVQTASFDAVGGVNILSAIIGKDNTALREDGDTGTLANDGGLSLPAGQTMTYRPEDNGLLNGKTYTLTGGGTLEPWQVRGTVIWFR